MLVTIFTSLRVRAQISGLCSMHRSRRPFGCIVARMGGLPKAQPARGEGGYLPGRIGRDLLDGHIEPEPVNGGEQNLRMHRLQKQRVRGEKRDGMMLYANAEGSLPMKRQRLEGRAPEEEDLHGGVCAAAAAPPLEEIGLPLISATSVRPRAERNRQVAAERAERAEARKYVTRTIPQLALFSYNELIMLAPKAQHG